MVRCETDEAKTGTIYTHFVTAFNDFDSLVDDLPKWVTDKEWHSIVLEPLPRLDGMLVRRAVLGFGKGKTCGDDGLVMEMVAAGDEMLFELIAECFRLRLLNHRTEKKRRSLGRALCKFNKEEKCAESSERSPTYCIFKRNVQVIHFSFGLNG